MEDFPSSSPDDDPSINSETEETAAPVAQILTRSSIFPSLSLLDAGDLIECYILTRMAKLKNIPSYLPTDNAKNRTSTDSTSNIMIRKSALAFRYIPKSTSSSSRRKPPFELTLEYGPQRAGATQSQEAVPLVHGHFRDLESTSGYEDEEEGIYLSWENDAKIYYTLSFSQTDWDDAHYMAPITGAVLSKIVDLTMDYPSHHPRYQPFTVVTKDANEIVLKSSNSDDFVWNTIGKLAEMYVDIKPVLSPRRYDVRFYVENGLRDVTRLGGHELAHRVHGNGRQTNKKNVANAAAEFYEKFYSCVSAIKTGDYSAFEHSTAAPIDIPSATPTDIPSTAPISHPVSDDITAGDTDGVKDTDAGDDFTTNNENDNEDVGSSSNTVGHDPDHGEKVDSFTGKSNDEQDYNNQSNNFTSGYNGGMVDSSGNSKDVNNNKGQHDEELVDSSGNDSDQENHDENVIESTDEGKDRSHNDNISVGIVDDEHDSDNTKVTQNGDRKDNTEYYDNSADEERRELTTEYHQMKEQLFYDSLKPISSRFTVEATEIANESNLNDVMHGTKNEQHGENPDESSYTAGDAQSAAEAAEKAAAAAKEAANSIEEGKAAEAAAAAAEAAKMAAQATSDAATQSAIDSLLSGDGSSVTSILSTCFSDPKYKITKQHSLTKEKNRREDSVEYDDITHTVVTTHAYLYLDGSNYYRLNLTAPYLDSVAIVQPIPQVPLPTSYHGDFIDWTLAMTIVGCFIFGIVVLMHHAGVINFDRRLRFHYFFHPHDKQEGNPEDIQYTDARMINGETACFDDEEEDEHPNVSNSSSNMHIVSPTMNGRESPILLPTVKSPNGLSAGISKENIDMFALREKELEMTIVTGDMITRNDKERIGGSNHSSVVQSFDQDSSEAIGRDLDFPTMEDNDKRVGMMKANVSGTEDYLSSHSLIRRDPDTVDFPDFKSTSKVAVPMTGYHEGGMHIV